MTCKAAASSPDFFNCTQCGVCCRGFGGTYVSDADIDAIAAYTGHTPATIREEFCAASGDKRVLAQKEDGRCVFWDQLCTIHPVKPRMCRRWPFIPSLLVDITNWRIMANSCPGIKVDIDEAALREFVRKTLAAENDEPGKGRS